MKREKQTSKASKKSLFLSLFFKNLGNVTETCKNVGITRTTFYRWIDTDIKFKNQSKEISESVLDFAESKLFERMQAGDTTAIIFFLKTKGKNRGYTEKTEIAPVSVEINNKDRQLTPAEAAEFIAELNKLI